MPYTYRYTYQQRFRDGGRGSRVSGVSILNRAVSIGDHRKKSTSRENERGKNLPETSGFDELETQSLSPALKRRHIQEKIDIFPKPCGGQVGDPTLGWTAWPDWRVLANVRAAAAVTVRAPLPASNAVSSSPVICATKPPPPPPPPSPGLGFRVQGLRSRV
jgi:hypothetical protein